MTVETPERDWTDSRLDDLAKRVDGGFEKVDERFEKVDARFEKVDARFEKLDADIRDVRMDMAAGFIRLDEKFDKKFDRLLFWLLAGMGSSLIAILATLVTVIVRGS